MFEKKQKAKTPKKPKNLEQLEKVTLDESHQIVEHIAEASKQEHKRQMLATDSEFWFSVVFPDRASKDKFLKAVGMYEIADKYLDGTLLAELMGIALDIPDLPNRGKIDSKYADLANPLPE